MNNPARFLSRWSRLKRQTAVEPPAVPAVAADAAVDSGVVLPVSDAEGVKAQAAAGSDLTALLREELSDAVRKQTLKAIFADPHFNVMDGLDTYIDDYSISESIPPEMMATLNQARFLFGAEEADKPVDEKAPEVQLATDCDNLDGAGQKVPVDSSAEHCDKDK
jgi:hypothetical protein